ncbi:MAG: HU family DNA-binding protein [Bacteroidales bacterium]
MIKLKKIQRPNPQQPTEPHKFYVTTESRGDIALEEMSYLISEKCTLTETDVLAALNALMIEMTTHLMNGKIVRFGTFGTFQLALNSSGVATADECSRHQVTRARVKFRPGRRIEKSLNNLEYSFVVKQ